MRYEFTKSVSDFEGICELGYLKKILKNLEVLDDDNFFVIARTNNQNEELDLINYLEKIDGKPHLILISDEKGIVPGYFDKFNTIFRTYNRRDLYDERKIFPIPCGYSSGHRNGWYDGENENKKMSERNLDIFYSGQKSNNRSLLENKLHSLENEFKTVFKINNGFSFGFPINEYYSLLQDCKISLVPNGAVIPESFRFFESMESSCAVITTLPFNSSQYNHWYYNECPSHYLNSWDELNSNLIYNILQNIDEIQEKTIKYYNNKLSSKAVANYIMENLNK